MIWSKANVCGSCPGSTVVMEFPITCVRQEPASQAPSQPKKMAVLASFKVVMVCSCMLSYSAWLWAVQCPWPHGRECMGLDSVLWTCEQLHEGRKVALHCRLRPQHVKYQIASTESIASTRGHT